MDAELERWKNDGHWFDYLGFEVFYRTEGSGPHLVLVHCYPFSSFDWTRIWPGLTERFEVIAPNMLGTGFSAEPIRYEYSVHDHAECTRRSLSISASASATYSRTTSA